MKMFIKAALVGLVLAETGCALFVAKETLYLKSAQDRASQAEIREHLGTPYLVSRSKAGDTIWIYQIRAAEEGGNNDWSVTGSWCDEYVLTFDQQGILRNWTHKSQKHRDEDWPSYCVTGGFNPTFWFHLGRNNPPDAIPEECLAYRSGAHIYRRNPSQGH